MAVIYLNNLNSDDVTVFPSGFRGLNYNKSKFTTEDNLTKLVHLSSNIENLNQCFINPYNSNNVVIYIKGYYFDIPKDAVPTANSTATDKSVYAFIRLEDRNFNVGQVLSYYNYEDNTNALLEKSLDLDGKFYGLGFVDAENYQYLSSDPIPFYAIKIRDSLGHISPQNLKLDASEIRGINNKPITEEFSTAALKINQLSTIDASPLGLPNSLNFYNGSSNVGTFTINNNAAININKNADIKAEIDIQGPLTLGLNSQVNLASGSKISMSDNALIDVDVKFHVGANEALGDVHITSSDAGSTTIVGPGGPDNKGSVILPNSYSLTALPTTNSSGSPIKYLWAQHYADENYINSWIPIAVGTSMANAVVMTDDEGKINVPISGQVESAKSAESAKYATSALKATNDSRERKIISTYVDSISFVKTSNNVNISYTKNDITQASVDIPINNIPEYEEPILFDGNETFGYSWITSEELWEDDWQLYPEGNISIPVITVNENGRVIPRDSSENKVSGTLNMVLPKLAEYNYAGVSLIDRSIILDTDEFPVLFPSIPISQIQDLEDPHSNILRCAENFTYNARTQELTIPHINATTGWFTGNVRAGGKSVVTSVNGNIADESGNINTTCFTKESIAKLYNKQLGTVYCDYEGNIVSESEVTETNWITMWNPATKTLTLNTNGLATAHQSFKSFVAVPYLKFNDNSTSGLLGLPLYLSVAEYTDGAWSIASSDVIGYVGVNSDAEIRKPCIQIWQGNTGAQWGFCLKKYDGTFINISSEDNSLVLCL